MYSVACVLRARLYAADTESVFPFNFPHASRGKSPDEQAENISSTARFSEFAPGSHIYGWDNYAGQERGGNPFYRRFIIIDIIYPAVPGSIWRRRIIC